MAHRQLQIVLPSMTPMRAGADGLLFARRLDGTLAWPGKGAFAIAGPTPLPHRAGMSNLDD